MLKLWRRFSRSRATIDDEWSRWDWSSDRTKWSRSFLWQSDISCSQNPDISEISAETILDQQIKENEGEATPARFSKLIKNASDRAYNFLCV